MPVKSNTCGIVLDPVFRLHETPAGHPEQVERVDILQSAIEGWKSLASLFRVAPEELDEGWLTWVHTIEMVKVIRATEGRVHVQLDPDTHAGSDSYRIAKLAAGSLVELVKRVLEAELERGFALVRPPGHHAESHRPMGFCLFNSVAIAAEFALRNYAGVQRVAIVDFDVHHGNGTQQVFYQRSDVLYLSSHQMPLYPGTGSQPEQGESNGTGFTLNFPLELGMGDEVFVPLYQDLVCATLLEFRPDLLLVSAGYDAHERDPLAGLRVSSQGFGKVVSALHSVAEELAIPEVYVLEGGYDPLGLSESVLASLEALLKKGSRRGDKTPSYLAYKAEAINQLPVRWSFGR